MIEAKAVRSASAGQVEEGSTVRSAVIIDHPLRDRQPPRPAGRRRDPGATDREATADYIAQLASELARLADSQRLSVLSYFLDMAACEAKAATTSAARG